MGKATVVSTVDTSYRTPAEDRHGEPYSRHEIAQMQAALNAVDGYAAKVPKAQVEALARAFGRTPGAVENRMYTISKKRVTERPGRRRLGGRLTAKQIKTMVSLHLSGVPTSEIAVEIDVAASTVQRNLLHIFGTARPLQNASAQRTARRTVARTVTQHTNLVDRFWRWFHGRAAQ